MRKSSFGSTIAVVIFVSAAATPAAAQAVPRLPDGKPNLQGIWQALNTAYVSIEDHQPELNMPGGIGVVEDGELPYTPEARKKQQENYANRATRDLVETKGFMPGTPRLMYMPFPFQIFQSTGQITMLFEFAHTVRWIYTNGTPHPTQGEITFYMGDARGRWEGDTLVVDVRNFNDVGETWFDKSGNHHSGDLHLVERYTLVTPDHINYEVTVEDPKVFTRPFKMSMPLYRRKEPNLRILEYEHGPLLEEEEQRQSDLKNK